MDRAMSRERRAAARVHFSGGVLPPAARIHPGREVIVVNLSCHGALVEGVWRLRPGARVELEMELSAQQAIVRGRIERCYVASLGHQSGIRYRAAIRFEAPVPFAPPGDLLDGYFVPDARREIRGSSGQRLPRHPVRSESTPTLLAKSR
jgi:hypothetical protein